MSQQQVTTKPTPIKKVERTEVVMVCLQQRVGFAQRNPYAMDVDRKERRNCYNCGGFGHLARNCRNRGMRDRIGDERRLEYRQRLRTEENNGQSSLNGKGDLVVLN